MCTFVRCVLKNRTSPIDALPPIDHNTRFVSMSARCVLLSAHAARRIFFMNRSPFVSVEGELARPRFAPLDGVPPFGREWAIRRASGMEAGNAGRAVTTTSCIDVEAPHRGCHWQPSSAVAPETSVAAQSVGAQPVTDAAGARIGRPTLVACWTVGALGIIGWLIAAHEPPSDVAPPLHTVYANAIAIQRDSRPQDPSPARISPPANPGAAPTRQAGTRDVATAVPSLAAHAASPTIAAQRPGTTPEAKRLAAAPLPPRSAGNHTTTAARPDTAPVLGRVAARIPPAPQQTHAEQRSASVPPRRPQPPLGNLDDPRKLIAMANALRGAQPAPTTAARPPDSGFDDWTSRLSHRRVTDAPDAFTR
ncbi:hypothetical protein ACV229_34740 [Burkholderia sp. MR1-5-21]